MNKLTIASFAVSTAVGLLVMQNEPVNIQTALVFIGFPVLGCTIGADIARKVAMKF